MLLGLPLRIESSFKVQNVSSLVLSETQGQSDSLGLEAMSESSLLFCLIQFRLSHDFTRIQWNGRDAAVFRTDAQSNRIWK